MKLNLFFPCGHTVHRCRFGLSMGTPKLNALVFTNSATECYLLTSRIAVTMILESQTSYSGSRVKVILTISLIKKKLWLKLINLNVVKLMLNFMGSSSLLFIFQSIRFSTPTQDMSESVWT